MECREKLPGQIRKSVGSERSTMKVKKAQLIQTPPMSSSGKLLVRICSFILVVIWILYGTLSYSLPLQEDQDLGIFSSGEAAEMVAYSFQETSPETVEEIADTTIEYASETDEVSDFSLFIGRFHPIFVHLPIGFLLMAFMLEFVGMIKIFEDLRHAVAFALLMGCLSGIAAGITGYLLSSAGGYNEDTLFWHKWLGVGVVVFSLAAFLIRIKLYEDETWKKIFRGLLIVMVGVVMTTGHFGGNLTHGSDYLFRYMPESLRSLARIELSDEEESIDLIADLDSAYVYLDIIEPILKTRCESCHNPDRAEGDLLLTSYEWLMAGGESGPSIVSGNSGSSELYTRLLLPDRDDKRMPPRGRTQLIPDQIRLISWWIDLGVPKDDLVAEIELTEEIHELLFKLTVDGQHFFDRVNVPFADQSVIDEIRIYGFQISLVSEDYPFLNVRTTRAKNNITTEDLELLIPIADQITWLDFSGLDLTDEALTLLSEFPHITRLKLQNTDIGDEALSHISNFEYLEYLNLYATEVTDTGLSHLYSINSLRSLYLWQTHVTKEGIDLLRSENPRLDINIGAFAEV